MKNSILAGLVILLLLTGLSLAKAAVEASPLATPAPARGLVPVITKMTPNRGPAGTTVTLTGRNFGTTPGNVVFTAKTGGKLVVATTVSWAEGEIILRVPPVKVGKYTVRVITADKRVSNAVDFTVTRPTPTPTFTRTATAMRTWTPTATATSTPTVTPTATATASPTASPTRTPTRTPAIYPSATPTNTPTATSTPTATATPSPTPVADPYIQWIVPRGGPVGTHFTLWGANFGAAGRVIFIGNPAGPTVVATIESWTDTQIRGTVPAGVWAAPYFVYVFRRDGGIERGSNPTNFTVTPPGVWTAPLELDRNEAGNWLNGSRILAAPNGTLWATWSRFPKLVLKHSADGGRSWQMVTTLETSDRYFLGIQPLVFADDSLYVSTLTFRRDNYDFIGLTIIRFIWRDGLAGVEFYYSPLDLSQAAIEQKIWVEGSRLHLAWRTFNDGRVYYARGDDYGKTWTTPTLVTAEQRNGGGVVVWARGNKIVVAANETDRGQRTYAYLSDDSGGTWRRTVIGDGYIPLLAESQGKIVAFLADDDYRSLNSFVSMDYGSTWEGPYAVPHATVSGDMPGDLALTTRADGRLLANWTDGPLLYASLSWDGRSWSETEVIFASDQPNLRPHAALGSDFAAVVWWTGNPDRILFSRRVICPATGPNCGN